MSRRAADQPGKKYCYSCKSVRPLDEFYEHRGVCKPCIVRKQRQRRIKSEPSFVSVMLKSWKRYG